MANIAQTTVDVFYRQLDTLGAAARGERAALDNQRDELQHRFTVARNAGDEQEMNRLKPLIHRNSALRLRYQEVVNRFNGMLASVSGLLARAGIKAPSRLGAVGVLPAIIVPAAIVATAAIVWGIIHEIQAGRLEVARMIASGELPPGYDAGGDPLSELGKNATTIGLIIAAIVLLPPILKMLPRGARS